MKETDLYVTVEPCIMCSSAVCLELPVPIRKFIYLNIKINFTICISIYYGAANNRFGGCNSIISLWEYFNFLNKPIKMDEMIESKAIDLLKKFYDQDNPNTVGKINE